MGGFWALKGLWWTQGNLTSLIWPLCIEVIGYFLSPAPCPSSHEKCWGRRGPCKSERWDVKVHTGLSRGWDLNQFYSTCTVSVSSSVQWDRTLSPKLVRHHWVCVKCGQSGNMVACQLYLSGYVVPINKLKTQCLCQSRSLSYTCYMSVLKQQGSAQCLSQGAQGRGVECPGVPSASATDAVCHP